MRATSIKSKLIKVNNSNFAPVYSSKSKIKNKYIPAIAVFFVLIIAVFALSNITPSKKAQASTPRVHAKQEKEVKIEPTIPKDKKNQEETCVESEPKFSGQRSQTCTGDKYQKTYECFDDDAKFNDLISSYALSDQTYMIDNIVFREGDIENTSRIMAAFKNTKCVVNLTSAIEDKTVLVEVFDKQRTITREALQEQDS